MIGSKKYQILTFAHLLVENLEELSQIAVYAHISLVGMFPACAPLMTDNIGLRKAHTQHVGLTTLPQLLTP